MAEMQKPGMVLDASKKSARPQPGQAFEGRAVSAWQFLSNSSSTG
jgi:hypothetical protein